MKRSESRKLSEVTSEAPREGRDGEGARKKRLQKAIARTRQRSQKRARRLALKGSLWIGVPTLIAAIYFGFIASDRYESISSFTVQGFESSRAVGLEGILGSLGGSASSRDVLLVRDYILSRDMLKLLIEKHRFREHYQAASHDYLSRLSPSATLEQVYEYYLAHVQLDHDTHSNVLTLHVQAFDAAKAAALSTAILEASEHSVNALAARANRDGVAFAEAEVTRAERRLSDARKSVLDLQSEGDEINPLESAGRVMGLRAQLEAEVVKQRAELRAMTSIMQPNAPQVVAQRERLASIEREVRGQSKRLVDTGDGTGINTDIARFEPAMLEKEFAERALTSALAALQLTRVDASRQQRYLVTIANPSVASAATHPTRLRNVLVAFVLSLIMSGLISLAVASVREHARL